MAAVENDDSTRLHWQLRECEVLLAAILNIAADAIIMVDEAQRIILFNQGAEQIFGYSADDVLDQPLERLLPPRLVEAPGQDTHPFAAIRQVTGYTSARQEVFGRRQDGTEFPAEASISKLEWGGETALTIILRDITERKQAEEALCSNEERFRRVVSSISDHIYVTRVTEDGRRVNLYLSPHIETLTGYPHQKFMADWRFWPRVVIHPDDRAIAAAQAAQLALGHNSEMEYRLVRANGDIIWVRDSGRAEREGTSTITYGVVSDITQRKQLEGQLRQSQKMEAVGRLAAAITHDFNNILTVISGHSELLLQHHPDLPGPVRQEIQQIKEAGEWATGLVHQLLAFSRQQRPQSQFLNLNQVVAGLEKMLGRLIGENIELTIKLDPDLGWIKADPGQIRQILMNLVVNAYDAMPRGGQLTLETANVNLAETRPESSLEIKPGPYVTLTITDTGIGMDADTRTHIFEPFFTTKEPGKGTGLGLWAIYDIIQQSNGYIQVHSQVGQGTTFKIYLPRTGQAGAAAISAPTPVAALEGTETILVVEDDARVRLVTHKFLEKRGYKVLETGQAEEALRICQHYVGQIDLLITDVIMPQMSGRELAERLARLRPQLKVLYTSGHADDALNEHGVLASNVIFLQKPFSSETLARKVRETLDIPS